MDWKTIDSAPRDQIILAHNPKWVGAPCIMEWDEIYQNWFVHDYGDGVTPQPTHWMPLPEPPNTTSEAYRDMIALWVGKLQHHENCAAAIIPYPGGIIAFGSREDVVGMLKGDEVQSEFSRGFQAGVRTALAGRDLDASIPPIFMERNEIFLLSEKADPDESVDGISTIVTNYNFPGAVEFIAVTSKTCSQETVVSTDAQNHGDKQ